MIRAKDRMTFAGVMPIEFWRSTTGTEWDWDGNKLRVRFEAWYLSLDVSFTRPCGWVHLRALFPIFAWSKFRWEACSGKVSQQAGLTHGRSRRESSVILPEYATKFKRRLEQRDSNVQGKHYRGRRGIIVMEHRIMLGGSANQASLDCYLHLLLASFNVFRW